MAFDSPNRGIRFHVQPRLWGETRFVTRRDELGARGDLAAFFYALGVTKAETPRPV